MDAPIALANQPGNFSDPDFRAVCRIERASRVVARGDDGKYYRTEDRPEPAVERAVDENGLGAGRLSRALLHHARISPVARRE